MANSGGFPYPYPMQDRLQAAGTWVRFEGDSVDAAAQNGYHNFNGPPTDLSGVLITVPHPPRRGDLPPEYTPTLGAVLSPQQQSELQDIDRVRRILLTSTLPEPLDPLDQADQNTYNEDHENGKILTTLKPTNERCAWITPPEYHPEMVSQKVVEFLKVPLEDYVMNLDTLVNDYRFRTYVILYKRLIGIWLLITLIILLALLFSGLRGLSLFVAGLIWLIIAGIGMCLCLYAKKKMNDGLKLTVASANQFMAKQQLLVGVEDKGKLSLHKIVLVVIHYDVMPCLAAIAKLLQELRIVQTDATVNVYAPTQHDLDSQSGSPMDKAERLMLRCVQPYVKELVRKRLLFSHTKVEDTGLDAPAVAPVDYAATPFPLHCKKSWCLCQFVDRMVLRRKPRKWYQKIWNED